MKSQKTKDIIEIESFISCMCLLSLEKKKFMPGRGKWKHPVELEDIIEIIPFFIIQLQGIKKLLLLP